MLFSLRLISVRAELLPITILKNEIPARPLREKYAKRGERAVRESLTSSVNIN